MTETAQPTTSRSLDAKLGEVRSRLAIVKLTTTFFAAIGLFVLILSAGILLDWTVTDGLSRTLRAALLAINIAAVVAIFVRYAIIPIVFPPDDERIALWVEREQPTFQSRLISAVQLTQRDALPEGASRSMLRAMLRETESLAQPLDFARVVKIDRLMRIASGATVILLLGLLAIAIWKETASDLLKRAFLVPGVDVPRKTRFDSGSGDMLIAKGDDVTLNAVARGYLPSAGTLLVTYTDGEKLTQEFPIERPDLANRPNAFERVLENVQESFTYRIRVYDNQTPVHKVTVVVRPSVASVECQQIYPPYTKLPPAKRTTGDLSLLAGSRLVLKVKANKPLKLTSPSDPVYNRVVFAGSGRSFPLQVDPKDRTQLLAMDAGQGSIPLPATPSPTTGLSIHLVDDLGLESKDSAVYRVDLVPDRPPTVRVTFPEKVDELVTPQATISISFDAADDFALGKLALHYRISKARDANDQGPQGDGVNALYYNSPDFTGHGVPRNDPAVDFIWGGDAPMRGIRKDQFSARWTGVLVAAADGPTLFYVNATGSMKVFLDGKFIAERGKPSSPITLKANEAHDLRVDFVESGGDATAQLLWAPQGQDPVVIPAKYYFTSRDKAGTPDDVKQAEIAIDMNPPNPKSLRGHYDWKLSPLNIAPGYVVEWWLEAQDTNDQTGPGKGASEHHQSRVVTEKQKRDELYTRMGDFDRTLDEMQTQQQDLSDRLGGVIFEKKK